MKLLALLFWFFVILYALRWLARLVLRGFVTRNFGQPTPPPRRKKEGEVTVEQVDHREKVVDRKVGEYIEYEEVKE